MTTTKTTPAPLTVGAYSLIPIGLDTLLYTGADVTLETMQPFVGRTVTVENGRAHDTHAVTLESVSLDRPTGDVTFWAASRPGYGSHFSVVTRAK